MIHPFILINLQDYLFIIYVKCLF